MASLGAAYEDPGGQTPMGFVALGGEFRDQNASHYADQKQPLYPRLNYSDNINWDTAAICRSIA